METKTKTVIQYSILAACAAAVVIKGNNIRVLAGDLIRASKQPDFKFTMDGDNNKLSDILDIALNTAVAVGAVVVGIAVYNNINKPESIDII